MNSDMNAVNDIIRNGIEEWNNVAASAEIHGSFDVKLGRFTKFKIKCRNIYMMRCVRDNVYEIASMLNIKSGYALLMKQEIRQDAKFIEITVLPNARYESNIMYALNWLLYNYFD